MSMTGVNGSGSKNANGLLRRLFQSGDKQPGPTDSNLPVTGPESLPDGLRLETGTSYETKGVFDAANASLSELGSQIGSWIPDPVPELSSVFTAQRTYKKMVRGDASVRVSLRAGKSPVLGADYYVEPFDDTDEAAEIQEFVFDNFFTGSGMTTPWLKFLEQKATNYENGFSTFEPVFENREWSPSKSNPTANRKVYTMLKGLEFRPAETISQFVYDDNGHLLGVVHNAMNGNGQMHEVVLSMGKMVIFTFDQTGGDPRGNSILRSAYRHWYYKDYMYKIDAIQKERHGIGIPDILLGPGASEQDKKIANEIGPNLRTNEKAYILRTPNIEVGFAEIKGQPVDIMRSAQHHDDMIMKNILVQFLNMGIGEGGGGRNSAATAQDMFMKSMRYIAQSDLDVLTNTIVRQLVMYNYKTDKVPRLKVRNIGEIKDFQMWSAGVANLINAEAITLDEDTENFIRENSDFPRFNGTWKAPWERPAKITEQETAMLSSSDPTSAAPEKGAGPDERDTDPSGGGQASRQSSGGGRVSTGNVGKSPGSGAV
jgi:hypothetical protein